MNVPSVEELCKRADVLSLHVPLSQSTTGMIGEKEIRSLRRGSVLLNTSRGRVVDEEAIIRALDDGHGKILFFVFDAYPSHALAFISWLGCVP